VALKAAKKIEIVSLVDNNVDFLSKSVREEAKSFRDWTRRRYGEQWAEKQRDLPVAEHGFSVLVRVFGDDENSSILFDTGVSSTGVVSNAERMGIDLREISYVVLSHGHYDHFGGLLAVVKAANRIGLPIIVHEDMTKRRGTINSKGNFREYSPFPDTKQLTLAELINTKKPYLIANDFACVTGEIPRSVYFEKGSTQNRIYNDNTWQPDTLIDERALVLNLKNKGLVVISGCAHAGIINTIFYAQKISGITQVHAVIGGFHLASLPEIRTELTIKRLKSIGPDFVAPSHCTGWRAVHTFADALPGAFVWNSVGNLYELQ